MHILAIDTSSAAGSAALFIDGKPLVILNGDEEETYSSRLFRWLEEIRNDSNTGFYSLDAVAVTAGPGSFTGLRIGVAAAKGISLSTPCRLIGFSTLEAMAYSVIEKSDILCPVLSAGRGEVYTAVFQVDGQVLGTLVEEHVAKPRDISLTDLPGAPLLFGNGLPLFRKHFEGKSEKLRFSDTHPVLAPTLAKLTELNLKSKEVRRSGQLSMNYIRLSDAERRAGC